jgi:V/A-type H+/Na+-transporting ATPase subunit E
MKSLDKREDKIQQICNQLRREAIDPAKSEAEQIIEQARKKGEALIDQATEDAKQMVRNTQMALENERKVFKSSLEQSAKQALEALRQEIQQKFFSENLAQVIEKSLNDPQVIAQLINGLVKDVEKKGIDTDVEVMISKQISAKSLNELLLAEVREKLKKEPISLDGLVAGVKVSLVNKHMTLEITDQTLKELLAKYIRKDFRQMLFNA